MSGTFHQWAGKRPCPICKMVLDNWIEVARHLRLAHKLNEQDGYDYITPHQCPACSKRCGTSQALIDHLQALADAEELESHCVIAAAKAACEKPKPKEYWEDVEEDEAYNCGC